MQRAYLLIVIPALVVGIAYFAVFHALGMGISAAPFVGAALAIAAAVALVRYYQRRQVRKQSGPS